MVLLPEIETLKLNKDFRRLYGRGRCFVHPLAVTYVAKNRVGVCRIGITTGKKVGNAVLRNRARRVITAAYRELAPRIAGGYDFVFVARVRTPFAKSGDVRKILERQLREAGVISREANTD